MSCPAVGRQRPVLAPAGHPGEDQPGIALSARLRSEAESLGDAGPEALDQHVGVLGQLQQQVDRRRVLQVQADRAATAAERVVRPRRVRPAPLGPVHPQHVGTEVSQDHAAERGRRQAGDLDHAHAAEWTQCRLRT